MAYVYLVTNLLDEVSLFLQFFSKGIDLFLLFRHFELLFDKRAMLFEKLVEQHRVYLVVAHSVNLTFLVVHD